MKPHKHRDAIIAWAYGADIQYFSDDKGRWIDIVGNPSWYEGDKYRVKPKEYPKTTFTHEQQMDVIRDTPGDYWDSYEALCNAAIQEFITSGEMMKYFLNPENGLVTEGNV